MNPPANLQLLSMDPETGETRTVDRDPLKARIAELEAKVDDLKGAVAHEAVVNSNLRSQISRMRGEQITRGKADALYPDAERVFEFWRRVLAPRAREFGDKRYTPVRARLNAGYTVEDFYAAIVGAKQLPESLASREAMQELEFIARNEKHMDRFISEGTARAEAVLLAMVRPLVHRFGGAVITDRDEMTEQVKAWYSPCPMGCTEPVGLLRLRVGFQPNGELVELVCRSGCEPKAVRDRLREMVRGLREQERQAA